MRRKTVMLIVSSLLVLMSIVYVAGAPLYRRIAFNYMWYGVCINAEFTYFFQTVFLPFDSYAQVLLPQVHKHCNICISIQCVIGKQFHYLLILHLVSSTKNMWNINPLAYLFVDNVQSPEMGQFLSQVVGSVIWILSLSLV